MKQLLLSIVFLLQCGMSGVCIPAGEVGILLSAEPRFGKVDVPYRTVCNVNVSIFSSAPTSLWIFPRYTFYAEQDGVFYILRKIEAQSGSFIAPFSLSGGASVSLPPPPHAGRWNIFAIQEYSPSGELKELDSTTASWTKKLVSNSIAIEFAELNREDSAGARELVESLQRAGQYEPAFKFPTPDPR